MRMLTAWLEKIFPERTDHRLVRRASREDLLRALVPTDHGDFISLLPFQDPLVRAAIHEAKFQKNERARALLAAALAEYLKHRPKDTILLPIPLGPKRQRKRGHNQVREVAKIAIARTAHVELNDRILYRARETVPQTTLKRNKRFENVASAFGARGTDPLRGRDIIVLDDVATTGATLKAAEAALWPHSPASITLLALAH